MNTPRPHAAWSEAEYLSLLHDQLEQQNGLLRDIRDRLPAPDQGAGGPAAEAEDTAEPHTVQISEPAPPAPKKRAAAKKTTAKATDQHGG
jgi:hypothetical protein